MKDYSSVEFSVSLGTEGSGVDDASMRENNTFSQLTQQQVSQGSLSPT